MLVICRASYIFWWGFGMIWGVTYQEMNGARAFLWTMSALTGAGLTNPVDGSFNLVVTAIYCLIGRPLHVYMSKQIIHEHMIVYICMYVCKYV